MKVFHALALAFAVTLAAWSEARATTVMIDDLTDKLTVSLDGTDLTGQLPPPPGLMVGSLIVTGGLISTGPGCNAGTGAECAVLQWRDPNVLTTFPSPGGSYSSPIVSLDETGGPLGAAVGSDFVSLNIDSLGSNGTQFRLTVVSNGEAGFALTPCNDVTGCVDLGLETGNFQDVATTLLTPVANCIICTLPSGLTPGALTAMVRSGISETTVPEPSTLLLLAAAGLAGPAAWRKWRSK